MSATAITALFLNADTGRIACAAHGGHYLAAAHDADPDVAWYDTPLGRWTRWTIADEAQWRDMLGTHAECETCGGHI